MDGASAETGCPVSKFIFKTMSASPASESALLPTAPTHPCLNVQWGEGGGRQGRLKGWRKKAALCKGKSQTQLGGQRQWVLSQAPSVPQEKGRCSSIGGKPAKFPGSSLAGNQGLQHPKSSRWGREIGMPSTLCPRRGYSLSAASGTEARVISSANGWFPSSFLASFADHFASQLRPSLEAGEATGCFLDCLKKRSRATLSRSFSFQSRIQKCLTKGNPPAW